MTFSLDADVRRLLDAGALRETRWSVDVREAETGEVLAAVHSHRLLPTASVAKVHVLIEVAARLAAGELDPLHPVDRRTTAPVADSGLWQHLAADVLPVVDVAALVGAVSDNLAANALVELVGLPAVQARAAALAPDGSTLHDLVRDVRGPQDPPTLSEGSASDWAALFAALARGSVESPRVSRMVLDWLAAGTDLSMVASAFGLDPLAHAGVVDRGIALWNKTGTDAGVRADVGLCALGRRTLSYAVVCSWTPRDGADPRDDVLAAMRGIGAAMRRLPR